VDTALSKNTPYVAILGVGGMITKGAQRSDECCGAALCCFGVALLAVFHLFGVLVE
jgi:hypothetical protein